MEDILSSIKRIIAEEGDGEPRPRRPQVRAVPPPPRADAPTDEVLELSHPMPPAASPASPIVSQETAQAARGALDTLSRLIVKPEPASDGTLEGLVRGMLRPMLSEWLDANLPAIVETIVAREIAKITGQGG